MSDHTLPLFSLQPETKEISLTRGQIAIVDAADYEWLMQWKWYAYKGKTTWYAARKEQGMVWMHRFILRPEPEMFVDHINRDGLDNRRANLRFATAQQNHFNRSVSARNKSGYKGVHWSDHHKKWVAQIRSNGKSCVLGRFDTAEEAARVYDEAAKSLHGEYACLNMPDMHIR